MESDKNPAKSNHQNIKSNKNTQDDDIRTQKQTLRRQIRLQLKALSAEEVQSQSAAVWERLISLPQYQTAKTIGLFMSMPTAEIQTSTILQQCHKDNKVLYVPRVGTNFEQADMDLIRVDETNSDNKDDNKSDTGNTLFYETWPRNKWGIPEPPFSSQEKIAQYGDLDVVIVPGLAFDRQGHRLGQGKGYYDRFLERIMKDNSSEVKGGQIVNNKQPTLVAVALQCQFIDGNNTVPVSSWDRRMDIVLIPSETIVMDNDINDLEEP
jgi:5-formyltetrahydrofolate cyclo-ligase